jgi:hypothetical protein
VAATHKTKLEIQHLLAARYPQPDVPSRIEVLVPAESILQQAPGPVEGTQPVAGQGPKLVEQAPGPVGPVPGLVEAPPILTHPVDTRSKVKPLAPQRYEVGFTMGQNAHDKLRYVQDLLGHQVARGDIAAVFERALDALIPELEKRKFAATSKPCRRLPRSGENPRHIPARVKRAVWKRDEGQCTYVSDDGKRCEACRDLQFDHIREVGRDGDASESGSAVRRTTSTRPSSRSARSSCVTSVSQQPRRGRRGHAHARRANGRRNGRARPERGR